MTTCLTPPELLLLAFFEDDANDPGHSRACASCRVRANALRARLSALSPHAGDHLDEMALAELLDAPTDEVFNDETLAHLVACNTCREELAALVTVVGAPEVRAELDRPEWLSRDAPVMPIRRRAVRIAGGALAAAAVTLFAVKAVAMRERSVEVPTAIRHATIDVAAAPRLIFPMGNVARVDTLVWTAVPHADRYRVTVFDESGATAWEGEAADTFVAVPGNEWSRWRGALRWRVRARTSFDRWVDSEFGDFTVRGGDR
jgi:hypothetical protein